ncbi:MAG: Ig-like domain-containing protein, partial [Verrucomicrobiales bacterium]|nr:Ig-like domain-containing protein [Verrucomicrobiales bacterium]
MTLLFRKLFFPCLLASLFFSVRAEETSKPLNFVNDIAPILTKADCNTGGCHAKAITGQRGFRLSLLGFEPEDDYEHIVKEGRGRRVFPQAPDQSLLLLKAANIVPHGGGKKLDPQSEGYQTLVRWIGEGMPYSSENDATLTAIEVEPKKLAMKVNTTQALKVVARYSDGSTRDVTAMSLFEANDRSMAEADATGLVKTLGLPGNVA